MLPDEDDAYREAAEEDLYDEQREAALNDIVWDACREMLEEEYGEQFIPDEFLGEDAADLPDAFEELRGSKGVEEGDKDPGEGDAGQCDSNP